MPRDSLVDALSDAEEEDCVAKPKPCQAGKPLRRLVSDLSDESSSHSLDLAEIEMKKRKRKRKSTTKSQPLSAKVTDAEHCKTLLRKQCSSCKTACLRGFLRKNLFEKLMNFREEWAALHNLDQDKVESQLCLSVNSFFKFCYFVGWGLLPPIFNFNAPYLRPLIGSNSLSHLNVKKMAQGRLTGSSWVSLYAVVVGRSCILWAPCCNIFLQCTNRTRLSSDAQMLFGGAG